jgi:hypothetical protein
LRLPPSWLKPFLSAGARGQQLANELQAEIDAVSSELAPAPRWAQQLLPYVRARLALALGVSPAATGEMVCALPARVAVTPSHIDVEIPLAALPIAVRLAGLDRDPGWVPAAGKHLAFHFTQAFAVRED